MLLHLFRVPLAHLALLDLLALSVTQAKGSAFHQNLSDISACIIFHSSGLVDQSVDL